MPCITWGCLHTLFQLWAGSCHSPLLYDKMERLGVCLVSHIYVVNCSENQAFHVQRLHSYLSPR